MLTVCPDPVVVESQLTSGALSCPCGGRLGPWAWARPRVIGRCDRRVRVVPRRSRCRSCRVTHVLLPAIALVRRADLVGVIGRALGLRAAGWGQRPIAALLGVPRSTVRGWLARFTRRAEMIRAQFVAWVVWLAGDVGRDASSGSPLADAVAAIVRAAEAAAGVVGLDCWQFAAAATGGWLLGNTTAPFPAQWTPTTLAAR